MKSAFNYICHNNLTAVSSIQYYFVNELKGICIYILKCKTSEGLMSSGIENLDNENAM